MEMLDYCPVPVYQRQGPRKCRKRKSIPSPLRILILGRSPRDLPNPEFFTSQFADFCREESCTLELSYFDLAERKIRQADALISWIGDDPKLRSRLRQKPLVQVLGEPQLPELRMWDQVTFDNNDAIRLAAEYLIGNGHRHVAFLSPTNRLGMLRLQIFQQICDQHGVKVTVLRSPFYQVDRSSLQVYVQKIRSGEPPVTGIFVFNTAVTLQLYPVLRANGIRPEKDLQIVTVDSREDNLWHYPEHDDMPRPATIHVHARELFQCAIRRLKWRMEHPFEPTRTILIRPELIPSEFQ